MFGDTLLGSSFSNTFIGLGGDDYIDGRGGFDTAGYNSLSTVTGGVSVNLASGVGDQATPRSARTRCATSKASRAPGFADTFNATGYGQVGAHNVSTSNGNFNQFEGLGGDDTITGNSNTRVLYNNATAGVTITIGAGGAGSASGNGSVGNDSFTGGVNSAIGSNFADVYDASAFNGGYNSFQGNSGNDTISGNGFTQVQYGNATSGVAIRSAPAAPAQRLAMARSAPTALPAASTVRSAATGPTATMPPALWVQLVPGQCRQRHDYRQWQHPDPVRQARPVA